MRLTQKLILSVCLVGMIGCSGEKRPSGLPDLYPCTITITQDKEPVSGVTVELFSTDGSSEWSIVGTTNNTGKAVMMTHGRFRGIPGGDYTVVLKKIEMEGGAPDIIVEGSRPASQREKFKVYSCIKSKYTSEETSPLKLHIDKSAKGETTFEIEHGEKELLGDNDKFL